MERGEASHLCEGCAPSPLHFLALGVRRRQHKPARATPLAPLSRSGIGRHSPDEIRQIGVDVVNAIADWLGDKRFMLGEKPHVLDATAYAFLAGWLWGPFEGAVKDSVRARTNLVGYCGRMKALYWA